MKQGEKQEWKKYIEARRLAGMLGARGRKTRKCKTLVDLLNLAAQVFHLMPGLTCIQSLEQIRAMSKAKKRYLAVECAPITSLAPKPIQAPSEGEIQDFYRSWDWKQLRYEFIRDKKRACMCCGNTAQRGAIIVVDHIHPIRRYWQLRLDRTNLQVLCDDCNMGKGSRDETDWRR